MRREMFARVLNLVSMTEKAVTIECDGPFAGLKLETVLAMLRVGVGRPLDLPIAAWNWTKVPDGFK
jgi:hypothetical protein